MQCKEFYFKDVLKSYEDFLTAKSDSDVLHNGKNVCENAHHMADHIRNDKNLIEIQAYHFLQYFDDKIFIGDGSDYRNDLMKKWFQYTLICNTANAKKHFKVIKRQHRDIWLHDLHNPDT